MSDDKKDKVEHPKNKVEPKKELTIAERRARRKKRIKTNCNDHSTCV